jgi:hypothetical protein
MLASGLLSLLRYGFGSLFVIGEDVAVALLRSSGADIAGTVRRLHASPLLSAGEACGGMLLAAVAASLVWDRPAVAALFATASACEAWWYGLPIVTGLLGAAVICALITVRG